MEEILKGLKDYLNSKRMAFPRFFFLSNDELLSILSQTKEPIAVQKFMNKCFEGIERLEFDKENIIHGMYSPLGEYVKFTNQIDTFHAGTVKNIEAWLKEVEDNMKLCLKYCFTESIRDPNLEETTKWALSWPSQIILTINELMWTDSVTQGIGTPKGLMDSYSHSMARLKQIVNLIKQDTLSDVHRLTLSSLIVLIVHGKDVIHELMTDKISKSDSFQWTSQLRYNFTCPKIQAIDQSFHDQNADADQEDAERDEQSESHVSSSVLDESKQSEPKFDYVYKDLNIAIEIVNTRREYGFEYIGNQPRLVVTPLTDRSYRTLMCALHMNLGGAPEGPAGTGKTETTKDLAKAMAKQILVFNCSEALDVEAMAKFFKGIASCGAWACFDEFNKIDLDVLSVIATQILTIQDAIIKKYPEFDFDTNIIQLDRTCAIFVTMNPDYVGRSELPDNLKALFRPVAMMIPNSAMIAEISLYSLGFNDARNLAVKITQSLQLGSEQLSTQSHYDYGMRAIKAIIDAAGYLKRIYKGEEEQKIILRAINESNVPKFVSSDLPLFKGIITDLFPKVEIEDMVDAKLHEGVETAMKLLNLSKKDEFLNKIRQIRETMKVRSGVMLVGEHMSGKSSMIKTLCAGISISESEIPGEELLKCNEEKEESEEAAFKAKIKKTMLDVKKNAIANEKVFVTSYSINPKSVTTGQLFGETDRISQDWHDGLLSALVRYA